MNDVRLTRSRFEWGYVRTLCQHEELPLLLGHLRRLEPEARHDRFNGFLGDAFLESYAARCAADGTLIVAYIENGIVRGAAELHTPDPCDGLPEAAFSVESHCRRSGVGTQLFARLIQEARWKGYPQIKITTGAQNVAMKSLALKFGANLAFRQDETSGIVQVGRSSSRDVVDTLLSAALLPARAMLDLNRACLRAATDSLRAGLPA